MCLSLNGTFPFITVFMVPETCVCVRVCERVCPHVSHTCLTQQLQQGGPATLCVLKRVLDDTEEAVQETKAHLQQNTHCQKLPHIEATHPNLSH